MARLRFQFTEAVGARVRRQIVPERTETPGSNARSSERLYKFAHSRSVFLGRVHQPTKTLVPMSGGIGVRETADSGHPVAESLHGFCQGRILEILADLLPVSDSAGLSLRLGE